MVPPTAKVTFLATGETLQKSTAGGHTLLYLPEYNPNKIKGTEAYVLKISDFGAYSAKPQTALSYAQASMRPTVTLTPPAPGAAIRYTTDGTEPTVNSTLYEAPFSPEKSCTIRAKTFQPNLLASGTQQQEVTVFDLQKSIKDVKNIKNGLNLSWLNAPKSYTVEELAQASVQKTMVVSNLEADSLCWHHPCALRWDGYLNIEQTGGYQFWTTSDDGSMIWIDDQKIVDNGGNHRAEEKTGLTYLEKGLHKIQVLYYNSAGDGWFYVHYAPLNGAKQVIPEKMLNQNK
jgi:hypothetical protein